jgi:undecaprenyl-diphosphatase
MNYFYQIDLVLFRWLNGLAGRWAVFDAGIIFLSTVFVFLWVLFVLFYGYVSRKSLSFPTFVLGLGASIFVSRLILVELVRLFWERTRPYLTLTVTQLIEKSPEASFPSGHTAVLFSVAAYIYPINSKIALLTGIFGLLVGLSRVISGVHYVSDVLAGVVVGILAGSVIRKFIN